MNDLDQRLVELISDLTDERQVDGPFSATHDADEPDAIAEVRSRHGLE
jgi:hypothetical protein